MSMTDNCYLTEIDWQAVAGDLRRALEAKNQEVSQLRDFASNVAGLDDRLLQNTAILKQWRDDARKLLG